jgi:hypothetical protein
VRLLEALPTRREAAAALHSALRSGTADLRALLQGCRPPRLLYYTQVQLSTLAAVTHCTCTLCLSCAPGRPASTIAHKHRIAVDNRGRPDELAGYRLCSNQRFARKAFPLHHPVSC